ncbi:unnamed protein product [Fusarium graminearum]|uniref:Chromosome 2, complete genome n=1 Tax=Gibberella zeae (strain ATCC MYA-4620 / CBS 123657 / FGSC 9075 / NRRL 31084 / PH-1) TaxID=229533 RepID=A0A1C3YM08_GIBZE|nr:unnamed protein product [Fusarium graminearum]
MSNLSKSTFSNQLPPITTDNQNADGHHDLSNPEDSVDHLEPSEGMTDAARKATVYHQGDDLNTVAIPCHHIRLGDYVMLRDRPCQVIRISTSAATGQYRYLGVDVFTKKLCEGVSFITSPTPSVVVQTMLGPTFMQYRLVNVDDGKIVAMTETGYIKQGLSVIDQSDLYARILEAFDSDRGSVRLLVLNDNGRELAVDMKVVHGSRPGYTVPEKRLEKAVRENDRAKVEEALRLGANINALNDQGRTALFVALENHDSEMVQLLLDHEVRLDVSDVSGKTALDVSVLDSGHYLTTFTLLKHGAKPTDNLEYGVSQLLLAAAAGHINKVERLLGEGVKHSGSDRLGYTALHEAACFGHYDIAKLLVEKGADVNTVITHGGATVLHTVVQRGREHREFLTGYRRAIPPLTKDHVRVVALLLQNRAENGLRRVHDKMTVQEVVTEELKMIGNLGSTERGCLQKILILLNSGHHEDRIAEEPDWSCIPNSNDSDVDVLKCSQLQVHYYGSGRDCQLFPVQVGNLMNGSEKGKLKEWAKSKADEDQPKDYWRWAHLPANNKSWAELVICQLSGMDEDTSTIYRSGIKSFTTESYHEIRGLALHARFRQPSFTPLPGSRGGIFSLVAAEVAKKLYEISDGLSNFHAPLTLDQSYYLSLHDSRGRDNDQVVIKHVERQERLTRTTRPKRLLMVNQMWIWKVDTDTLVTACPDRRHPYQSNLSEQISATVQTSPPSTMDSIISRVLRHVIGFVNAPNNAGLKENVFHIFEQSIAYRAQEDADCYANFNRSQKDLSRLEEQIRSRGTSKARQQKTMEIEAELCNITKEVDHLCEIKDIKDELKMIHKVLDDQKAVIHQYTKSQEELNFVTSKNHSDEDEEWLSGDGESELLLEAKNILEQRISKVKSLFTDASTVENSLNHLLDLKQKQGNLIVVRDTRSLANEADQRAKDSAWQSKLLFIFTIVTVVFTPISFISSFMAVPTREFPHPDGDDVAWRWWQVFVASTVVELLTFFVIAPWVEWNRFVRPWTRHDSERVVPTKVEDLKQPLDV